MIKEQPIKEIVTVTEMSRMCGLSRSRFYQLVDQGVFPTPSRRQETQRPFYDRQQQEQCLMIRRTNRGANNQVVLFNGCRLERGVPLSRKPRRRSTVTLRPKADSILTELRHGLAQLGAGAASDQQIRIALAQAYPDGHRDVESAELLRTVFGELQRRNSADNLDG